MIAETTHPGSVTLRPVTAGDLPMLAEWFARPHVQEWWGDAETQIGRIRAMLRDRDRTRPFIFRIGRTAAGYVQYSFFDDHKTPDQIAQTPWLNLLPAGSVGIDIAVAEAGSLSRGTGSTVVRMMAQRLWRDGHRSIVIDPHAANARAVRAYEKAGFEPLPELTGKSGDFLIMRFRPRSAEAPCKD